MRLIAFVALPIFMAVLAGGVRAQPWQSVDPASDGWSVDGLKAAQDYATTLRPTAVMVVQDGKGDRQLGDVSREVTVASVRKSLLSALYGIAVSQSRIDLRSTLADLGIDDKPPALTGAENGPRCAICSWRGLASTHPAAYETGDMRRNRPERGSHVPGTFWFYDNWDFNALGTIYGQQTGEDIFQSFAQRIAQPIGMQDFSARDGTYVSEHHANHPPTLALKPCRCWDAVPMDVTDNPFSRVNTRILCYSARYLRQLLDRR